MMLLMECSRLKLLLMECSSLRAGGVLEPEAVLKRGARRSMMLGSLQLSSRKLLIEKPEG